MDAFNAGSRFVEIGRGESTDSVPTFVLYPSAAPERQVQFGPYTLSVCPDSAVATGLFPLVVISHGTGGSPLVYRTLARHLARNGFIVLLPEHPRNNRNNNELAGTSAILANRPKHIRLVMDWAFANDELRFSLKPNTAAIVGHSLGGYTALAAAGGVPTAFPHETPNRQPQVVDVVPDARVRALVLLTPAAAWFMKPGALDGVRVPILMLTAEHDPYTPAWHAQVITQGLSDRTLIASKIIANAGHFSFQSPFPPAMINPAFLPSQDPEGFDRERFQIEMNADIVAFLNRVLPDGGSET